MRHLTTAEIQGMRGLQSDAMMDLCTLQVYTPTTDAMGTQIDAWTDRAGVPCGLNTATSGAQREQRRGEPGIVSVIAAVLRLRIEDGSGLTPKDSIIVTHRNGELLDPPLRYGIDGPVNRGVTAITVNLVEVR